MASLSFAKTDIPSIEEIERNSSLPAWAHVFGKSALRAHLRSFSKDLGLYGIPRHGQGSFSLVRASLQQQTILAVAARPKSIEQPAPSASLFFILCCSHRALTDLKTLVGALYGGGE